MSADQDPNRYKATIHLPALVRQMDKDAEQARRRLRQDSDETRENTP